MASSITIEERCAKRILESISVLDLHPGQVAFYLAHKAGGQAQKRLFQVFVAYCRCLATNYDMGLVDDRDKEMYNVSVYAKRISEMVPERQS